MANKKPNKYIIDEENNLARIELRRNNKENLWTTVDLEDLKRIMDYRYSWHVHYDEKTGHNYATSTNCEKLYPSGSNKRLYTISLHKFIMEEEDITNQEYAIDHINHDTLDNRKSNLRLIKKHENDKNRISRNSNNTTGYRNVMYLKSNTLHPYVVKLQIDGKSVQLGSFSDVHEAGEFAEEMRQKYYGEYAGNN